MATKQDVGPMEVVGWSVVQPIEAGWVGGPAVCYAYGGYNAVLRLQRTVNGGWMGWWSSSMLSPWGPQCSAEVAEDSQW